VDIANLTDYAQIYREVATCQVKNFGKFFSASVLGALHFGLAAGGLGQGADDTNPR
jgi:hypothetical protein